MIENLTPMQQKVFEMLLNGIPPKEIAYNLHIAHSTLLSHQKQLYRKLDVHSVKELIKKYAPANIIAPESVVVVQEGLITGRWLEKRSGEVKTRKKMLPVKWRVIFGILPFAVIILFFMIRPTDSPVLDEGFPAVFNRWAAFKNEEGISRNKIRSSINITVIHDDIIDGKSFTSFTMYGVLYGAGYWSNAGMTLYPVPITHQAMKKMTSFSFKVLGDGRHYRVNIPTTDTQLYDEDCDHYSIMFPTINGQISTITVNADDLMQGGYDKHKQVPFIRNNIIDMEFLIVREFLTESSEPFHLKVWDIRIF